MSNTNLSYQQVLQMTNKSIPPIMKNLFNEPSTEQNQYMQQMSYQSIPYGYYAPPMQYPMPYQMPYPMPYPMQMVGGMPMQPMQQFEAPAKDPEAEELKTTSSSIKTKEKPTPEATPQKDTQKQQVLNNTYATNMSQQIPMQQYPVYQPQFPYAMPPAPPVYYPYYPPQMPYQYGVNQYGGQYGNQYGGQYGGYMPCQYMNPTNFN